MVAQLDRLFEGISDHEASRPRRRLLERRMTVECFLIAALAPQQLLFGATPDVAAPWRFAFDGEPSPLVAVSDLARERRSAARDQESGTGLSALAGRYRVSFARPVGGDDPVVIAGRLLVRRDRAMLAATWCEPCLAPDGVDFPILPEGFLLEWDEAWRTIRVRLPTGDRHAERTLSDREAPPRFDQPDDVYDLFDGLRPLPWLLANARERDPRAAPGTDEVGGARPLTTTTTTTAGTVGTGRGAPDQADWVARAADGRETQRVKLVRFDPSELTLLVEQPPLETRWASPERYELVGDVLGSPLPARSIRPEGTILAHPDGVSMTLTISTRGSEASSSGFSWTDVATAKASIETASGLVATIEWDRLRPLDRLDADRLEASFRHAFDPAAALERGVEAVDPFISFDAGAAARRALRTELRTAIAHGTKDDVLDRLDAHLDRLADDGLPPSVALRSIEALEERLLGGHLDTATAERIDLAWRETLRRSDLESLLALLHDRVRQGRFGAAWRLASTLGDPDFRRSADRRTRTSTADRGLGSPEFDPEPRTGRRADRSSSAEMDSKSAPDGGGEFARVADRISRVLGTGPGVNPPWHRPPGRERLDSRLLGATPRSVEGREMSPERAATGSADAPATDPRESLAVFLTELLDEGIAECGTRSRRGPRDRLTAAIERHTGDDHHESGVEARGWSEPDARRRLGDSMRIFLAERRHLLATHLRSPAARAEATGGSVSEFERDFEACLERLSRLGPSDAATRSAGDREESVMLATIVAAGDRLLSARRCSAEAAELLRAELGSISDARRLRRGCPCFPAFLRPLAPPDAWQASDASVPESIGRAVADDPMLDALAERVSIEEGLIAADPSTATFRTAMRSAQIEALATRLDAVMLDAIRRQAGGDADDDPRRRTSLVDAREKMPDARPPHSAAPADRTVPHQRHEVANLHPAPDEDRFARIVRWILEGGTMPP